MFLFHFFVCLLGSRLRRVKKEIGSNMSKKGRKSREGRAPTQEQQQKAELAKKKKEFIKGLMKADRLVVFTGNNRISHWGMPANGDLLLFLLNEVYGWDGKNEVFQKVLAELTGRPVTPEDKEDDLEDIFSELEEGEREEGEREEGEQEDSTLVGSGSLDGKVEVVEEGTQEDDKKEVAKVVPMGEQKGGDGEDKEGKEEEEEDEDIKALREQLAALKAKKKDKQSK